jgi:hypothetical protein
VPVLKRNGRFGAILKQGGKQTWLGTFDNEGDARAALALARKGKAISDLVLRGGAEPVGEYLFALSNDPCGFCSAPGAHIEHIEPRSRGGADDWTNYATACARCNQTKGTLSLLGFLASRLHGADARWHRSQARAARAIGVRP